MILAWLESNFREKIFEKPDVKAEEEVLDKVPNQVVLRAGLVVLEEVLRLEVKQDLEADPDAETAVVN